MSEYVVVDLEMCRVPAICKTDTFRCSTEIIQIGAVLLDDNFEIVDGFNTYVHPEFGVLDPFIEGLTGITQNDLDQAPDFEEAITDFTNWLPQNVKFVEWSESDLIQLKHEIKGKRLPNYLFERLGTSTWIDCQKLFTNKTDTFRVCSLTEALNLSNIDYMEGAHNGYVDAYNTALLFGQLKQHPNLVQNAYYKNLGLDKSRLTFSIGDLFKNLQLQY